MRVTRAVVVTGPGWTPRRNCTVRSMVAPTRPVSAITSGPMVSSIIAVRNPPCTTPIGFTNASRASKPSDIVIASRSKDTKRWPNVAAAGGIGRPSNGLGSDMVSPRSMWASSWGGPAASPLSAGARPPYRRSARKASDAPQPAASATARASSP